jgi:hypothetical protein
MPIVFSFLLAAVTAGDDKLERSSTGEVFLDACEKKIENSTNFHVKIVWMQSK